MNLRRVVLVPVSSDLHMSSGSLATVSKPLANSGPLYDMERAGALLHEAISYATSAVVTPQWTDANTLIGFWRTFLSAEQRGPTKPALPGAPPVPRYPLYVIGWYRANGNEPPQIRLSNEAAAWIEAEPQIAPMLYVALKDCAERLNVASKQHQPLGVSVQIPRAGTRHNYPTDSYKLTAADGLPRSSMMQRHMAESIVPLHELLRIALLMQQSNGHLFVSMTRQTW